VSFGGNVDIQGVIVAPTLAAADHLRRLVTNNLIEFTGSVTARPWTTRRTRWSASSSPR
jgi:hypothetical protein